MALTRSGCSAAMFRVSPRSWARSKSWSTGALPVSVFVFRWTAGPGPAGMYFHGPSRNASRPEW